MNFIDLKSGSSVEGDAIKAYRSENKSKKYIYLMAGVHGDEVEGIYVLKQLFEWLKDQEEIQLPFIVIPVVNVDGFRVGNRVNSHGVDLNRNLPSKEWSQKARAKKYHPGKAPMSEPENQFLEKLLKKFPPKIIFTFHSWIALLYYNGDCQEIAVFLSRYNSYPVSHDITGHPTPGSLGEYGPEKYKCPVLTFECPPISEDKTLKDIWEENREGLENLFKSDLL